MKTSGLRASLVKATALTTLFGTLAVPYTLAQEDTISLDQDSSAIEDEARQDTIIVTGSLIPQAAIDQSRNRWNALGK